MREKAVKSLHRVVHQCLSYVIGQRTWTVRRLRGIASSCRSNLPGYLTICHWFMCRTDSSRTRTIPTESQKYDIKWYTRHLSIQYSNPEETISRQRIVYLRSVRWSTEKPSGVGGTSLPNKETSATMGLIRKLIHVRTHCRSYLMNMVPDACSMV